MFKDYEKIIDLVNKPIKMIEIKEIQRETRKNCGKNSRRLGWFGGWNRKHNGYLPNDLIANTRKAIHCSGHVKGHWSE